MGALTGSAMTDQNAQNASPPPNLLPQSPTPTPSRISHRETDTRENTFLNVPASAHAHTSTAAPSSADFSIPSQTPSASDNRRHAEKRLSTGARAHKHRSSGGFLLSDSLLNRHSSTRHRDAPTNNPSDKRHRRPAEQHTSHGVAHRHGQDGLLPRASSSNMQGQDSGMSRTPGPPEDSSTSSTLTKRDSFAGDTAVGSSRTSIAQLDMESAQIVNMALNLSESRRLASRRVSQPTPPRLAPLPDNAPGGSLRYHLQQQRKASRTVSPKPDRSPRIGGARVFTPLQPAFEPGASYRYHFSQSTLARAQKAKEYLDLMAQYRRALELVPPLEPERTARPWAATPPVTPNGSAPVSRVSTSEPETRIGRPYNPLQYIRNRKVRARERKAIDGEAQGFGDVLKVSEWIDGVAKWVATGQGHQPGNPILPPFPSAQAAALQASPPSTKGRTAAVTKPRRPRVDWVIDPADMLADVYWLELDDNKKLVEDRHWRRVFPQGLDVPRPTSHEEMPHLATPGSAKDSSEGHSPSEKVTPEPAGPRHDHEHGFSAARDRAQQKLRALKGSHRPSGSVTNRDLLRLHRGSLSESSDTDTDRRRRAMGGAGTVRSLLEKQMEEMIAQEQREAESHPLYDAEAGRMRSAPVTPEREPKDLNMRGRADSRAELSETDTRGLGLKPLPLPHSSPPQNTGRASLEVPRGRRLSGEGDTSQPNSPNLRPTRDVGHVPAIGMDLSRQPSRPSSPHRNPLTKVKSIFRERSKERERIPETHAIGEDGPASLAPPESWLSTPDTTGSSMPSPQRRPSRSPIGDRVLGHRSHKSLSSARLRGEDGGISFRSLLRGPRIDTVLRSGVSKVSDMLWRKEDDSSSGSSDDSDAESRGRPRGLRHGRSLSVQYTKNLLEAPQLLPDYQSGQFQHPPSRPVSRRSSRFDLLKPPRIDVQNASPSTSPPPVQVRQHEPIGSDTESQADKDNVRAAAARLDAALARPNPHHSSSRHWSITDRSTPPTRSTVSNRDIARLRALLLSAGIHAQEMDRRAKTCKLLPSPFLAPTDTTTQPANPQQQQKQQQQPRFTWHAIAALAPDEATQSRLLTTPLAQTDLYPVAARTLATSIHASASDFQSLSARFSAETAPALLHRVESLRGKVAGDLTALTNAAADAADEASYDLAVGQRLKVKRVVDAMEKMLRRRRRRFRWVRRAGWLVVEWLLVGCMWYVWFLVMIVRVVLGVGKGVVGGVRWLLWL